MLQALWLARCSYPRGGRPQAAEQIVNRIQSILGQQDKGRQDRCPS